jgi:endoglucanase
MACELIQRSFDGRSAPASDGGKVESTPGRPGRRPLLGAAALVVPPLLMACWAEAQAQAQGLGSAAEDWAEFRRRFLAPEGRVVDTGNRNASHTEGQGYALLASLRADDPGSFSRILAWTFGNLRRRGDELCSWRFQPDAQPAVTDPNNATDGDLCIAWALIAAGQRWRNSDYTRRGTAIGRDLLRLCTVRVNDKLLLLPAAFGFQARGRTVLNLSYYVFPALRALAEATGDSAWPRQEADGLELLRQARFGRWSLPPDWLEVRHADWTLTVAANWPSRFSFDAVRIPLHMVWGGFAREPCPTNCATFWFHPSHGTIPAWTDLRTGQGAPYPANAGIVAVARLTAAAVTRRGAASAIPRVAAGQDYYAAALVLLARMAWRDLDLG